VVFFLKSRSAARDPYRYDPQEDLTRIRITILRTIYSDGSSVFSAAGAARGKPWETAYYLRCKQEIRKLSFILSMGDFWQSSLLNVFQIETFSYVLTTQLM